MADLTLVIGNKNYSSWSLRPWIAMKTAGIDFDEELIPFDFESGNPEIKAVSPNGKVPMLVHGDLKVSESIAILEYLTELCPEKAFWPEDAGKRAVARAYASEMATGFFALRGQCPFNMHREHKPITIDAALKADISRIDQIWKSCLDMSGGPFLFGGFSAVDAMYAPVVGRFDSFQLTPSSEAATYMNSVKSLPAWQEWREAALRESWVVNESEV